MAVKAPQEGKDTTIKVLHKKKDWIECGNYRGPSLITYARKILLKIVANRHSDFCEKAWILPDKQCGFLPQSSTTDMTLVVRRPQELGRKRNTSLKICFIDLANVYNSVGCVQLWEVLARFLVPPRMIKAIRMIHDSMRARVQLHGGHFSGTFNICQGLRQRWVLSLRLSFASSSLQQVSEDIAPNCTTNGTPGCRSRSGYSKRR